MPMLAAIFYYFTTPFSAAWISRPLLNDFPNTTEDIVLLWVFLSLVGIPSAIIASTYAVRWMRRTFSHPLERFKSTGVEPRRHAAKSRHPQGFVKQSKRATQINL